MKNSHQHSLWVPPGVELCTSLSPQKGGSFHSAASLSAEFSKRAEACGESDTVSLFLPGVQIRLSLRFALLPLHQFCPSFTSSSNLLRLVINMDKNQRISACVDMAGRSWTVHLTMLLSLSLSELHMSLWRQLLWNHSGKGWVWTKLGNKLLSNVCHWTQNARCRRVCCYWSANVVDWNTRFVFLFCFVFSPCSCRRLTSPACMGSGAAGPASQKKKKKDLYLM